MNNVPGSYPKNGQASKNGQAVAEDPAKKILDQYFPSGGTQNVSQRPDDNALKRMGIFPEEDPSPEESDQPDGRSGFSKGLEAGARGLGAGALYSAGELMKYIPGAGTTQAASPGFQGTAREIQRKAPENDDSWGYFLGSLIPSVAPSAAAIAAAPFTGGASLPMAASMGLLGFSSAGSGMMEYERYKQEKGQPVDPLAKLAVGTAYGGFEAAAERFSLGRLMPKGLGSKFFLKGNTEAAEKVGRDMLDTFRKAHPSRFNQIANQVRRGLSAEGLEEVATEIGQTATDLMYQEGDDRIRTVEQLPANLFTAFLGGSIMGAGLGPLSYASQSKVTRDRRKRQGGVVIAKNNADDQAYELIAQTNTEAGKGYQALSPDGQEVFIPESDIGESQFLSVEQFDKLLRDKLDLSEYERASRQPVTVASYNGESVQVISPDGDDRVYVRLPDGTDKNVHIEDLDDVQTISPEEQMEFEGRPVSGQQPVPDEEPDGTGVLRNQQGDFIYPGDPEYEDELARQQEAFQGPDERGISTENEKRTLTVGKGKKKQQVVLSRQDDGSFVVDGVNQVENDGVVSQQIGDMTPEEVNDIANSLQRDFKARFSGQDVDYDLQMIPEDPADSFSPMSIQVRIGDQQDLRGSGAETEEQVLRQGESFFAGIEPRTRYAQAAQSSVERGQQQTQTDETETAPVEPEDSGVPGQTETSKTGSEDTDDGVRFSVRGDYTLSDVRDNKGSPFIQTPEGSIDFGEITPEIANQIRRQAAPVRLPEGNEDYGKEHIRLRHGSDILLAGFNSVEDFVNRLSKTYSEIRKADRGGLFLVNRGQENDEVAVVKLVPTEEGDTYSVNTAGIYRSSYLDKRELLWKESELPSTDADSVSDVRRSGQSSSTQQSDATDTTSSDLNIQNIDQSPQIESEAFKNWFGDSEVVDKNGEPLVVYHGTGASSNLTEFNPDYTGQGNDQIGSGFYFTTDPDEASAYTERRINPYTEKPGGEDSPGVLPVYLSIKNPIRIEGANLNDADIELTHGQVVNIMKKAPDIYELDDTPIGDWIDVWSAGGVEDWMIEDVANNYTGNSLISLENDFFSDESTAFREALRDELGYDGVVQEFDNGKQHWVAWFPQQIKSATGNRGTFDPENPDIRFKKADPFYSELQQTIQAKLPGTGTPASYKKAIQGMQRKGNFRKAEIKWIGLYEWLDSQEGKIQKKDVIGFIEDHNVQLEEVMKGDRAPSPITEDEFNMFLSEYGFEIDRGMDNEYAFMQGSVFVSYEDVLESIREEGDPDDVATFERMATDIYKLEESDVTQTKYGEWQLPGGENYREMLITLPTGFEQVEQRYKELQERRDQLERGTSEREQLTRELEELNEQWKNREIATEDPYRSSHWDEPNVLAHVRMNDRVIDGKRTLFLEEVQSDLHQAGRKKGYKPTAAERKEIDEITDQIDEAGGIEYLPKEVQERSRELSEKLGNEIPNAPFKSTWHELVMKRMIRYAAENGYDNVAWAPGEVHNERYDLSKQVDEIDAFYNFDGTYEIHVNKNGRTVFEEKRVQPERIEELIGKEMAKKIISDAESQKESFKKSEENLIKTYKGLDLKVGGEGMKGFYDKILPRFLNKYLKKWDSKLGVERIITEEFLESSKNKSQDVWSFPVTEDMRQSVLEAGQPLFKIEDETPFAESGTQKIADHLLEKISNWDKNDYIHLVTDESQLPEDLRRRISEPDDRTTGVYDSVNNQVYLLAYNMYNEQEADLTLAHEVIGHFGIRGLVNQMSDGRQQFESRLHWLFSGVYDSFADDPLMQDIANRYRLDLTRPGHRLIAGDEFLAHLAETDPNNSFVDRAISLIQGILRKLGINTKFSKAEIRTLLVDSKKFVEGPQTTKLNESGDIDSSLRAEDGGVRYKRFDPLVDTPHQFQKRTDNLLRNWQDKFVDVRRIQQGVVSEGGTLTDQTDTYLDENRSYGRIERQMQKFSRQHADPLTEQARELYREKGIKYSDIDRYLKARHAPERNAYLLEVNPEGGPAQSGSLDGEPLTDEKAAAVMAEYREKGWAEDLESIATRADGIAEFIREKWLESGLISEDRYNELKVRFPNYVPLRGFADFTDVDPTVFSGDYNLEGRQSEAGPVLPYLMTMADTAIISGEKNKVKQTMLNFIMDNWKRSDLFRIRNVFFRKTGEIDPETRKTEYVPTFEQPTQEDILSGKVKRELDPDIEMANWDSDLNPFSEHRTLRVSVEGRPVVMEFKNEHIPRAFKNLNAGQVHPFIAQSERAVRGLRNVITQYSPEFSLRNLMRDSSEGYINLSIDFNPLLASAIVNPVKIGQGFASLRNAVRNDTWDGDWGKATEEFMDLGGMSGWWQLNEIRKRQKDLQKEIERGGFLENPWRSTKKAVAKNVLGTIDDYNRIIENIIRVSTYKYLTDHQITNPETGQAFTKKQAASYAKDLTVNFNRKGGYGGVTGSMYLFFNAAVQGISRLVKPFFSSNPHIQMKAAAAPLIMASTAYLMTDLVRILMGRDDDDEYYYDKIDEWTRQHFVIFPNLLSDDPADFFRIPLPYGYNVYWAAGDAANRIATGSTDLTGGVMDLGAAAMDSFNPIGTESGASLGGSAYKSILPTVLKPGYEMITNSDFAGRPIKPEPFPFAIEEPQSQQYFPWVSSWARETADFLNKVSGGDEVTSGLVDVSPEYLEYLATYFGGGSGRFINGLINTGENLYEEAADIEDLEAYDIYEVPFARGFYGKTPQSAARTRFMERRDELDTLRHRHAYYIETGQTEKANQLYEANKQIMELEPYMDSVYKQIRNLYDMRKVLQEGPNTKAARERIDQIEDAIDSLYDSFNLEYNQRGDRSGEPLTEPVTGPAARAIDYSAEQLNNLIFGESQSQQQPQLNP